MENSFESFYQHLTSVDRNHRRKDEEFLRLCVEPSSRVPVVGDTVVVAAGLIGRGFDWVREEATVIAVGDTSFKVRWLQLSYKGNVEEQWVHPVLITDVIGQTAKTED